MQENKIVGLSEKFSFRIPSHKTTTKDTKAIMQSIDSFQSSKLNSWTNKYIHICKIEKDRYNIILFPMSECEIYGDFMRITYVVDLEKMTKIEQLKLFVKLGKKFGCKKFVCVDSILTMDLLENNIKGNFGLLSEAKFYPKTHIYNQRINMIQIGNHLLTKPELMKYAKYFMSYDVKFICENLTKIRADICKNEHVAFEEEKKIIKLFKDLINDISLYRSSTIYYEEN
jgi:hypothetical protein